MSDAWSFKAAADSIAEDIHMFRDELNKHVNRVDHATNLTQNQVPDPQIKRARNVLSAVDGLIGAMNDYVLTRID